MRCADCVHFAPDRGGGDGREGGPESQVFTQNILPDGGSSMEGILSGIAGKETPEHKSSRIDLFVAALPFYLGVFHPTMRRKL